MNNQTLETQTLVDTMEERARQYETLREQFNTLKHAFQNIVDLDDFRGQGANAIKGFYRAQIQVVEAWIQLIDMQVPFFQGIKGSAQDRDLDGDTIVHMPFLEHDLKNGESLSLDLVEAQRGSLQSIFSGISDILSLEVFSTSEFDGQMNSAKDKREETISHVEYLDSMLTEEYQLSVMQESMVVGLYQELLNASSQGGTISPLYFDSQSYESSEVYQMREESRELRDAYVEAKAEENENRRVQEEMEKLANRPWYEKAWEGTSTFVGEITGYNDAQRAATGVDPVTGEELSEAQRVTAGAMAAAGFIPVIGWAGRAFKGGKAVYQTGRAVQGVDHALDAYQSVKAMDILKKTEYGIYGLASYNGVSEYIIGKDMFGNELSEEQRQQSLTEALFILGVGGAGAYADKVQSANVGLSYRGGNSVTGNVRNVEPTYTYNMVENPGPLAEMPNNPAANFAGGKYNSTVLDQDEVFFRSGKQGGLTIPGKEKNALGQWFTREPADSAIGVRIDSAVKPQWIDPKTGELTGTSPIEATYAVKIPKGTTIYDGPVGYQGGPYLGGEDHIQIFISEPWKIDGREVLTETKIK